MEIVVWPLVVFYEQEKEMESEALNTKLKSGINYS